MNLTETEQEILEHVRELPPERQQLVLAYIQRLQTQAQLINNPDSILKSVGILSDEDAEQMRCTIEEGCERVERDAW